MTSLRSRLVLIGAASALALAAALPAIGQEAPESLLPPGFGNAADAPEEPEDLLPPQPGQPSQPSPDGLPPAEPGAEPGEEGEDEEGEEDEEEEEEEEPDPYDIPPQSRRDPRVVGVLTPETEGMDADAWGGANGRYLSALMRRIDAPVASRWNSILLRRALLSRTPAPRLVSGADWAAERAWLLIRMGEADSARRLVQGVDVPYYTPKMFDVAMQSALANADPMALCPLTGPVAGVSDYPSWELARAMCASLAGEVGTARAIIESVRRRGTARGIDLLLAEKVVGAGPGSPRAITIQWDGVDQLTAWRFGLAKAVGVAVPGELFATVGPHVQAWRATVPMLPISERPGAASWAATMGVLSSAAYVDLFGALYDATDPGEISGTTADTLRTAYVGVTAEDRLGALRSLWDEFEDRRERYSRLILTARAAARIPANEAYVDDAGNLIAAMLTAGLDRRAARWAPVIEAADEDDVQQAWALLAVSAPRPVVDTGAGRIRSYINAQDDQRRAQMLVAALAGLGRIPANVASDLAEDINLPLGRRNRWTIAIQSAARNGQPATVALIAAAGMQTRDWRAVPPAFLYHIVSALRRVGHEPEARMIAAEALTRL